MVLLYGTEVTLRPVLDEDVDRLVDILAEPEVARWRSHHATRIFLDTRGRHALVVQVDGNLVGGIQYQEEPSRDYRHAAIDVFLDPSWHGKGIGADAVRTLARHLIYDLGHHRLTVDLVADNAKAIRSYRRVGFHPVGTMREYEYTPSGAWRDALLMDLLRTDLQ